MVVDKVQKIADQLNVNEQHGSEEANISPE